MRQRFLILGALCAIGAMNANGIENDSRKVSGSILGVHVSEVEPALVAHLDLELGIGLVVEHVDPGSPADEYGLQKFDILTEIEGQILVNPNQLSSLIRAYPTGEDLRVGLIRHGKTKALTVQLSARKQELIETSKKRPAVQILQKRMLSMSVEDRVGSVKVDLSPGSRWVSIRDHLGQEVYGGLLETEEDFTRVPDPYEASLELIRSLENKIATEEGQ